MCLWCRRFFSCVSPVLSMILINGLRVSPYHPEHSCILQHHIPQLERGKKNSSIVLRLCGSEVLGMTFYVLELVCIDVDLGQENWRKIV
jgi:hypothetical protein